MGAMGFASEPTCANSESQKGEIDDNANSVIEEAFARNFGFESFWGFRTFENTKDCYWVGRRDDGSKN